MSLRRFQFTLIALALLLTQWAGLSHSIEHHPLLRSEAVHSHQNAGNHHADLFHSCLLFDGLTTAQGIAPAPVGLGSPPRQTTLRARPASVAEPGKALFAQRIRVRDPPFMS